MAIFSNNVVAIGTSILNGKFEIPVLISGISVTNTAALKYWSAINGSGTSYSVGNGAAFYGAALPSTFSQYFVATNVGGDGGGGGSVTLTQNIKFDISGTFLVQFYAFPGAIVDPTHSITLYFNKAVIQTGILLGSVANGGYQAFSIPISVPVADKTFTLGFAFQCTNAAAVASSLCLSYVRMVPAVVPAARRDVVDPSAITFYYPLDASSNQNNYGTGVEILDSTAYGGALVASSPAFLGTGYLSLASSLSQYLTLTQSITVNPPGVTLCGWFNLSGVNETAVSTILTVGGGGAGSIGVYANTVLTLTGISNYLTFGVKGSSSPVINGNSVTFVQNAWYFFALVTSGGAYQCYLNSARVATVTGSDLSGTTYTSASVGYDAYKLLGTGVFKYSYFNGSLSDLRMYKRTLSVNELSALWTMGVSALNYPQYNLIDTTGFSMYYGFETSNLYGSTYAYMGLVNNGSFSTPVLVGASSAVNAALDSWTIVLSGLGDSYRVHRSTSGTYTYGLPAAAGEAQQYLAVTSVAGSTTTLTQPVSVQLPGAYVFSFVAFPADGGYFATQTLTITLGTTTLVAQVAFPVRATTAPYAIYNINVALPTVGSYLLSVTVTQTGGGTGASSTLGLTGMLLTQYALVNGMGYSAVDPSGLVLYFPSDAGTNTENYLNNYATGTATTDTSMASGAQIATASPWVGSGYLQLNGTTGYLNTVTPFTVGSAVGSGFTVSFWFNALTPTVGFNTFFVFLGVGGGNLTAYYTNTAFASQMLMVSVAPPAPGISSAARVDSNRFESSIWNHFVLVGQRTAAGAGGGSYTIYLNDVLLASFSGDWCPDTFTSSTLGYNGTASTYMNGNLDDFRVYTRALSTPDVDTLWDYGTRANGSAGGSLSGLIDTMGLTRYYPFDQGTLSNATYVANYNLLRPGIFYNLIDVSSLSMYYSFEF